MTEIRSEMVSTMKKKFIHKYIRSGFCTGCGQCCNIKAYPGKPWVINPEVSFDPDGFCSALDRKTMKCTIYNHRPKICQEFPYSPRDLIIFPQCGYKFTLNPEYTKRWKDK